MLENLSLKKLSIFVISILVFIAVIFSIGSYRQIKQVDEINTAWLSFKSQHAEKARLEISLRATLGYGGMIHDFKNYILRKDFERLARLQKSMGAAQTIVTQYFSLSTTQAEKLVLSDIREALNNYQAGIELARDEIKKGKSSKKIDERVRINDHFALRGLEVLRQEISSEYNYYKDRKQKPVLASLIRAELGYGGMIHSFKNYVLRGDDKYYKKTVSSIQQTESMIGEYRELNPTLGEKTALDDIGSTLKDYKNKLLAVKKIIKKGRSPEQIDKLARVSDKHALRGLITLDHDIILQIDEKSKRLSKKLVEINEEEEINTYITVIMILLLALYLYGIFAIKIINPIKNLSVVMSALANGKMDVNFDYPVTAKTELGDISRAFIVFQENEVKRKVAEEEVQRLAMTDPLTGLANRNQFEKRYGEMTTLAKREEKLIALFALDLDKFKPINDNYGHAAGDVILKNVAENLLLIFRETDLVARIGGDEFSIILYGPESIETIESVAKRVIKLLSAPILVGEEMLSIGTSVGIATLEYNSDEDMDSLMQRADELLYDAKEGGRNTYRINNTQ